MLLLFGCCTGWLPPREVAGGSQVPASSHVLTHTCLSPSLHCADINTAFDLLHSGQCLRCVLTFDQ